MTLVDTNILLDLLDEASPWREWSLERIMHGRIAGPLVVNEIVYAELAVRFETKPDVDAFIEDVGLVFGRSSREALYLASQAFRLYRRQGGPRTGILPDFFVGAHAAVAGCKILTRDTRRYVAYYPDVELIAPAGR